MYQLNKPIFIIAMHRTGSTLLKNILDRNSDICMATDEMHLIDPFRTRFYNQFEKFKHIENDDALRELVDLIFSDNIYGTFWKDYKYVGITKKEVFLAIRGTDKSFESVLTVILDLYRKRCNKKRVGVKYPLHFSKVSLLKDWFPDAKIILLHRDIRAVCASKIKDEATQRRKRKFGFLIHYITLFIFIFEYIWLARSYKKYNSVYYKVNYEDLILEPKNELKKMCKFCEIPFESSMLLASGKASSHTGKIEAGIDKNRINLWKNVLSIFDINLINFLTKPVRRIME